MGLYSRGHISVGADFTVSTYRAAADKIAKESSVPNGVLAFRKNQDNPDLFTMPSADAANSKYDELAEHPGDYAYIYLYRDNKPVDEGYFVATSEKDVRFETKVETRKERVGLGWILGGVGVGLLALSIGFRQRRS